MEAPLSQREFDSWRQDDTLFKENLLARLDTHIAEQTNINLGNEGRLSTVETRQDESEAALNRKVTWVSAVVAAVIGGLVAVFGPLFTKGS